MRLAQELAGWDGDGARERERERERERKKDKQNTLIDADSDGEIIFTHFIYRDSDGLGTQGLAWA